MIFSITYTQIKTLKRKKSEHGLIVQPRSLDYRSFWQLEKSKNELISNSVS